MKWLALLLLPLALAVPCSQVSLDWFTDAQIIVGSKADVSDAVLASKLAYLITRDSINVTEIKLENRPVLQLKVYNVIYTLDRNTTILPYNITIQDLNCRPNIVKYYNITEPNTTNIVILDNQIPTRQHRIIVGGWYVNKYAGYTKGKLKKKGDLVCEQVGNYLYVAGWTAGDTVRASHTLVERLRYRRV